MTNLENKPNTLILHTDFSRHDKHIPGEDDVGVAAKELAPGLAGDGHHLHVLDPPHLGVGQGRAQFLAWKPVMLPAMPRKAGSTTTLCDMMARRRRGAELWPLVCAALLCRSSDRLSYLTPLKTLDVSSALNVGSSETTLRRQRIKLIFLFFIVVSISL